MVIDSSALIAILRKEPNGMRFSVSGEPILCKGSDFRQTDISTVTPASEPQ